MSITVVEFPSTMTVPVMISHSHQIKKPKIDLILVGVFFKQLAWTIIGAIAIVLAASVLLEFVGIYSVFNFVIYAIYVASGEILKVLGLG